MLRLESYSEVKDGSKVVRSDVGDVVAVSGCRLLVGSLA